MDKKTLQFIDKARKVHGSKYIYDKVQYINNRTKINIICPEHGEFWQTPENHLAGQGCPLCGGTKKLGKEGFVEKANLIHGGLYDYSKVEYVNNKTKVTIICPEHGEFKQTPHNHLKGQGCPLCGKGKTSHPKFNLNSFIEEANRVHDGRYDYSDVVYSGVKNKVKIICPEHGPFWQIPYLHIQGAGCPVCARLENGIKRRSDNESFVAKAREVHGSKYDYSKVKYITAKRKVCIVCPDHGEFWQTPDKHLAGCGCPRCASETSSAEREIFTFCKKFYPDAEQSNKTLIRPYELDIYIPSIKTAIEYNGLFWHTIDVVKKTDYHLKKLLACQKKGIKLIQVFEDEFLLNKELVYNKISSLLHLLNNNPRVMARRCQVKQIEPPVAKDFLLKNHIQGYVNATLHLGAFYHNHLIGVMSFRQETKGGGLWELSRYASDNSLICQGLGGKLFAHFVKEYNPSQVKSFADRRWTINEESNLYTKLGFDFVGYTKPDYRYVLPGKNMKRLHKFAFRKAILHKKYGLPLSMTEDEMTKKLGYTRVYDCGLIKYVYTCHN
jgi:hypothetical protein